MAYTSDSKSHPTRTDGESRPRPSSTTLAPEQFVARVWGYGCARSAGVVGLDVTRVGGDGVHLRGGKSKWDEEENVECCCVVM